MEEPEVGPQHPCYLPGEGWDHDMKFHSDSYGADDVINGTCIDSWWECETCGWVDENNTDIPDYSDLDYL